MTTNAQIAFNPQGKTVVIAADAVAPVEELRFPAGASSTVYVTPGGGL